MDSNFKGNIGEAKALGYFIKEGYEVYLPFGTATKSDLIVVKDRVTYRVSVKTTSSKRGNSYVAKIRQGKLKKQEPFNKEDSDILFIYVLPEDKIFIFNSSDVKTKFEIYLKV